MADADEATSPEAAEQGKKGKSSQLLIIIVAAVVLVLGGGASAYFLGVFGGGDEAEAAKKEGGHRGDDGHGEDVDGANSLAMLDTFVVNLNDPKSQRYLKVTMQVEFFGDDPPERFSTRRPQIRDLVLTLLSSKGVADVRTIEGKQQLRDEVIARINRVIDDDVVKAIYFAEFIVQ